MGYQPINEYECRWMYKKTLSGMVLMVKDRSPTDMVGEFKYKWRKATE